jgi:hypothetical protein
MKNKDLASSIIQKQFWTIIILILCLVVSNGVWIWYISQYDFSTESVEQSVDDVDNSTINQKGIGK